MVYIPTITVSDCPSCGKQPKLKTNWRLTKLRLKCECGVSGRWVDAEPGNAWNIASRGWHELFPLLLKRPPPPFGMSSGRKESEADIITRLLKEAGRKPNDPAIDRITLLDAKDGDLIVVTIDERAPMEAMAHVQRSVEGILKDMGRKAKVIVLDKGMDIKVVRTSELDSMILHVPEPRREAQSGLDDICLVGQGSLYTG